jgi:hypothetical protein
MTTPATPLLLYDNVFDHAVQYPSAALDASDEPVGTEAFRVADYRRERSYWQPSTDGGGADHFVRVDLGTVGALPVDYLVIDRDSNLWGKTVYLEGSADGATWTVSQALNIPVIGTVGGNPTWPSVAVTEEGVVWGIGAAPLAAKLWWRLRIPYTAAFVPLVTGVMAGTRLQLLGYSSSFDEDAGQRTQSTDQSTAGYRGQSRTFAWRTAQLQLAAIGAAEYDAALRAARTALFTLNVPAILLMDYVTRPERGWLYQYEGTTWGMPKQRVLRAGSIPLRECGHRVG